MSSKIRVCDKLNRRSKEQRYLMMQYFKIESVAIRTTKEPQYIVRGGLQLRVSLAIMRLQFSLIVNGY